MMKTVLMSDKVIQDVLIDKLIQIIDISSIFPLTETNIIEILKLNQIVETNLQFMRLHVESGITTETCELIMWNPYSLLILYLFIEANFPLFSLIDTSPVEQGHN